MKNPNTDISLTHFVTAFIYFNKIQYAATNFSTYAKFSEKPKFLNPIRV